MSFNYYTINIYTSAIDSTNSNYFLNIKIMRVLDFTFEAADLQLSMMFGHTSRLTVSRNM